MKTFNDKTYCASPHCENECGHKMTSKELNLASISGEVVAWAYYCGDGRDDKPN